MKLKIALFYFLLLTYFKTNNLKIMCYFINQHSKLLDNISNNRFDLTNISPIVADSKKIFRKHNDDFDINIKDKTNSYKIKHSYKSAQHKETLPKSQQIETYNKHIGILE